MRRLVKWFPPMLLVALLILSASGVAWADDPPPPDPTPGEIPGDSYVPMPWDWIFWYILLRMLVWEFAYARYGG